MADRPHNEENISRRLASLIVTRSPSSRGEIPEDNLAESDADDRSRGTAQVEQGDAGELEQQA